jgi:heme-degrading monooxygenase HmoA
MAYQHLLTGEIAPGILARGIPGLRDLTVWRRDGEEVDGAESEFLTVMRFDERDAVAAFTGGDPTHSVVPAAARRLLAHFDEHSQHYTDLARFRRPH